VLAGRARAGPAVGGQHDVHDVAAAALAVPPVLLHLRRPGPGRAGGAGCERGAGGRGGMGRKVLAVVGWKPGARPGFRG
jgi:hypothetical protein